MVGTKAGSRKAVEKIKEKYGPNFYAEIGRRGGKAGRRGGFAVNPGLAARAGKIGGKISRRGPAKKPA
jgi:general stress protein YciG